MDIQHSITPAKKETTIAKVQANSTPVGFKSGVHKVATSQLLPQPVRDNLSALSHHYGLPIDLGNFSLVDSNPENIKALRAIADMAKANSKLLPEVLKLTKQLMSADIKAAQFQEELAKASLKHGEKLDRATANIFLAFAKSTNKAAALEQKTNARKQLLEQRNQKYAQYYANSVYGAESELIDVEFDLATKNQQILKDSKVLRKQNAALRKHELQAYLDTAF